MSLHYTKSTLKLVSSVSIQVLFSILLVECSKEKNEPARPSFIIAGDKSGYSVYQDMQPDMQMVMLDEMANGIPTTSFYGDLFIDANLDGSNEIHFHAFSDIVQSYTGSFVRAKGCMIERITGPWFLEICPNPLSTGDTINNDRHWQRIFLPVQLAYDTVIGTTDPISQHKPWNNLDAYLAFRMLNQSDTLYGWISMELKDYIDIKIKECCLQK